MHGFLDFLKRKLACGCGDPYEAGPSKIHGHGVIITRPVKKGACLGITHKLLDNGMWEMLKPLGDYNHSSTKENAIVLKGPTVRKIYVLRDMSPGEEMLVDFRKQADLEQPQEGWLE